MKTIDFANNATVKTIVNVPHGIARDPQLHFDGNKIVFAMRRTVKEDYHIWQVNTDGSNLTQLTSAAGVSDFDPIYLPDDCIAFSSTRQPKYNMCSLGPHHDRLWGATAIIDRRNRNAINNGTKACD